MWIAPIFDRTAADVTGGTPKGFCNASDLHRLESNCQAVGDMLGLALSCHTAWDSRQWPTQAHQERICDNLAQLRARYSPYVTTPPAPLPPLNHWEKWNQAEQIVWDIRRNLLEHKKAKDYSGERAAGQPLGLL